jgi:hypothetical protein
LAFLYLSFCCQLNTSSFLVRFPPHFSNRSTQKGRENRDEEEQGREYEMPKGPKGTKGPIKTRR